MLKLIIQTNEMFDEVTETFIDSDEVVLYLEHSLLSLSKWESEHEKPFLGPGEKTPEEILSYIKAMIITPDYSEEILNKFNRTTFLKINDYIDSKQSATTFGEMPKVTGRREVITSELIYYWMVAFNIPFECEKWHLNRLFSLIRICNVKQSKPKKMSRSELAERNRHLNAQRKASLGTRG